MKKRIPRRILTAVLSLAMLLTLLPAAALAADETGGTTTSSGIELSKTATLEDDGTYTIDLEAYATGETTTTTKESSVPLDIVLVIDQSGSMSSNLSSLKTAVTNFVNTISDNAKTYGVDHRIAIVGYASRYDSSSKWANTGLFVNGSLVNYATAGSSTTTTKLTATDYKNALVSVNDSSGNVTSSITTAISNFSASGATYISYGIEMANGVFENNDNTYTKDDGSTGTRQRIVVVFTDGEPGKSGYEDGEAGEAVNKAYETKNTYGATVYTVGFYSNASTNVTNFMNYLSSNYPSAKQTSEETSSDRPGGGTTTTYTWVPGTQAADKYYMTTSNSSELSNIFTTIAQDTTSSSTTVTLDANSVMKDIMGDGFTLADDFNVETDVTIKTVAGSVVNGEIVWGNETENSASASVSGNTVSITGFNYAEKYISSGHEGEKICVTIKGVLPTTSVTTDEAVSTNAATSGIYADASTNDPAAVFEQPQTIITKKLYVLDYAKTATLTGLDQDTSVTGIVDGYKKVTSENSTLTQSYGKSAVSETNLTYTPTTTNWNGYDSLYVFGKTTNSTVTALEANSNGNLWSKVSVIPANNVYYEDDFITNESTGTVGIVYTGTWTEVGSTNNNTETANNDVYGWVESLSDDDTYSDGTAHAANATTAKATFTFTGTGVDIYSRTDMNTGNVKVTLKGTSEGNTTSMVYICDNESVSGTYYQIPTVSFENLEYDTYTVTIKVATNATDDEYTYYLDGIRVYNPLGTVTDDGSDAGDAYKADNELNAVFTEVRDILIDANSFTADYAGTGGVVFIDNNVYAGTTDENGTENSTSSVAYVYADDGTVTSIGTYEDLGPKNEVYLAAGQSIAFKVEDGDNYYLGLKSADGKGTKATVTDGSTTKELTTISHTTDLYYEITPTSDGYIMVKNTGSNLLSITKLRSTSATSAASGIALLSADEVDEIMVYAASFDSLQSVASTETGVEEDSFVDTEIDTETDVDTETGDVVEDLDEDDIVIENPTEDTDDGQTEESEGSSEQSTFSSLFNNIRNWFNGRR